MNDNPKSVKTYLENNSRVVDTFIKEHPDCVPTSVCMQWMRSHPGHVKYFLQTNLNDEVEDFCLTWLDNHPDSVTIFVELYPHLFSMLWTKRG